MQFSFVRRLHPSSHLYGLFPSDTQPLDFFLVSHLYCVFLESPIVRLHLFGRLLSFPRIGLAVTTEAWRVARYGCPSLFPHPFLLIFFFFSGGVWLCFVRVMHHLRPPPPSLRRSGFPSPLSVFSGTTLVKELV